ncbi:MAG: hypothetical protein C4539_13400, partial [Ignavibacteriales bacterium]
EKIEPLLKHIGKKEHYIHMFNVHLIGRLLFREVFGYNFDKDISEDQWTEIAYSHDLAYPIEAIEEELKAFLEVYFNKGNTPRIIISKELLYTYGNFLTNLPILINNSAEVMEIGESQLTKSELLEDLVLSSLYNLTDHAVISALFVLHANNRVDKYTIAIPILLHNLHQWKYFAIRELHQIIENAQTSIEEVDAGGETQYSILQEYKFVNFIIEKRCKREVLNNRNSIIAFLKSYKIALQSLQIKIEKNTRPLVQLTFILAFSDFLHEWGRLIYQDKGIVSMGLRIKAIENNIIELICPYLDINNLYLETSDSDYLEFILKHNTELATKEVKLAPPKSSTKSWKNINKKIEEDIFKYKSEKNLFDDKLFKNKEQTREPNGDFLWEEYIRSALYKLFIFKLREFTHKFLYNGGNMEFRGLYNFKKDLIKVRWNGIKDVGGEFIIWPK